MEADMRATVTIEKDMLDVLVKVTKSRSKASAVKVAINEYLKRKKLEKIQKRYPSSKNLPTPLRLSTRPPRAGRRPAGILAHLVDSYIVKKCRNGVFLVAYRGHYAKRWGETCVERNCHTCFSAYLPLLPISLQAARIPRGFGCTNSVGRHSEACRYAFRVIRTCRFGTEIIAFSYLADAAVVGETGNRAL
jgi:hypothetical protein